MELGAALLRSSPLRGAPSAPFGPRWPRWPWHEGRGRRGPKEEGRGADEKCLGREALVGGEGVRVGERSHRRVGATGATRTGAAAGRWAKRKARRQPVAT